MELLVISLIYSLTLFGVGEMFIYFSGPFNILEYIRSMAHWIHPKFGELFTCIFCFSTWCGGFISALNYFLIPIHFTPFNIIFAGSGLWWLIIPFDTFFGCGVVWLLHVLDDYLESNTKVEYEDE